MPSEGAVAFLVTNDEEPVVLKGSLVSSKKSYASPLPPTPRKQKTMFKIINGGRSKSISPPRSKPAEWTKGEATSKLARAKSPSKSRSPKKTPTTSKDVKKLWMKEPYQESSICLKRNETYKAVDVHYITNLMSCFEKIKSSYTCGPTECPSLQQRLHKHRFQHHSTPASAADDFRTNSVPYLNFPENTDDSAQTRITFTDLGHITISKPNAGPKTQDQNAPNRQDFNENYNAFSNNYHRADVTDTSYTYKAVGGYADKKVNLNDKNATVSNYTTTDANYMKNGRNNNRNDLTLRSKMNGNKTPKTVKRYDKNDASTLDNNNSFNQNIGNYKRIDKNGRDNGNTNYIYNKDTTDNGLDSNRYNEQEARGIPIKNTETHSVLPSNILRGYRNDVQEQVKNWLLKIPLYPSDNSDNLRKTENAVNELVEVIKSMANEADTVGYEAKLNREIDKCIDALDMWYPNDKREQIAFRNNIRNNLWEKIDNINRNMFYNAIVGNSKQTGSQDRGSSRSSRGGSGRNGQRAMLVSENTTKCTVASGNLCACTNETKGTAVSDKKGPCNKSCISCSNGIEAEITDWVNKLDLLHQDGAGPITKRVLTDILMDRLKPYFNIPSSDTNKAVLKSKILEIMQDLSVCIKMPGNRKMFMNKFSDDLAHRLLGIQARLESSGVTRKWPLGVMVHTSVQQTDNGRTSKFNEAELKQDILEEVKDCLDNTNVGQDNDIAEDVTQVLYNQLNAVCLGNDNAFKSDVCSILEGSRKLNNDEIPAIIDGIIENIKDIVTIMNSNDHSGKNLLKTCLSGTISVYTSEQEISGPTSSPIASSTPKKVTLKEDIPKLNAEEKSYQDSIANMTWNWLNNLPKNFNVPKDKSYQEVMVNDFAGEITDYVKSQQLSSDPHLDKDMYIPYFTCKWLAKFQVIENVINPERETKELVNQLKEINIPNLKRPQHGSRQVMDNLRHMEGELGGKVDFVPKSKDILEDEISIWMNEQPKNIYKTTDPSIQDKMISELAVAIQPKLVKKRSGIDKDIAMWLKKIVKTEDEKNIRSLSKHLATRIKKLPQDKTLEAKAEKKVQQRKERAEPKPAQEITTANIDSTDTDKTMKDFIIKYIQRNYDVDDTMARGAFAQLLKSELRNLNASTIEKIYKNPNDKFSPQMLDIELLYIEDVSDWLKNIPINASYNSIGNKDRVEFVTDLAKNIADVEVERVHTPLAMDYNNYLAGIICSFMELLPIITDQKVYVTYMIDQLLTKIVSRRPYIEYTVVNMSNGLNRSGVAKPDISNFVEQYVKVNAQEIADDHLKMNAWSARLLQEVKKMVNDEPRVSQAATVKANDVTKPEDDSVKRFDLKLEYAAEISEWLKNLPLVTSKNDLKIQMISNLAEFMCYTHMKKDANPKDKTADKDFDDYVNKWITELPLDRQKEINLPIVTQQLKNRMEKVGRQSKTKETDQPPSTSSRKNNVVKNSFFSKTVKQPDAGPMCNPGTVLVDVIEKWCNGLPFLKKNTSENEIEAARNEIARRIFQIIGELNDNPGLQNDDFLYRDMLEYEIDSQLDQYFSTIKCKKRKDELKLNLLKEIMEARKAIKDFGIGNKYKRKLENMVESSIPHPMPLTSGEDPGFELYKKRLADLFIITNFDHSDDTIKINYENQIKEDINKYFPCVQARNAIPLTNEEMSNELYCSLYKVPIPEAVYLKDEVEDIKTRLEIDAWFQSLPLPDPKSYYELLERDQMLVTLTKRIREFERCGPNSEEKMYNEIRKWLKKLPLMTKDQNETNKLTNVLQTRLKSTVEDRKCVTERDVIVADNGKFSKVPKSKGNISKIKGIFGTETVTALTHTRIWISPSASSLPPYVPDEAPPKKYAQEVLKAVEEWCQQLPLPVEDQSQAADIRDNLATKIVMKISELNTNPDTLNDDVLQGHLLDTELEKLLSSLPESNELVQSKVERKNMLKDAIKSLQPLMQEDKERVLFKKDLHEIVAKVLNEPKHMTSEKMALLSFLREEIVEGYLEYHYNRHDEQGKHFYKKRIHEALTEYLAKIMTDKEESAEHVDSLLQGNKLLCQMLKVPSPNDNAVKNEVLEIRMKNEVADLFDDVFPNDDLESKWKKTDALKSLAKQLNEMEMERHTSENAQKMKGEITKALRKLGREVSPCRIDNFIKNLKQSEPVRKAPPVRKAGTVKPSLQSQQPLPQSPQLPTTSRRPGSIAVDDNEDSSFHPSAGTGGKWYTLEPVTPRNQGLPAVETPNSGLGQYSPRISGSPYGAGGPTSLRDLNKTPDDYNQFGREVLTSTPIQETASSPLSPVTPGRPIADVDGAGINQDSSFHPSAGTGGKWYTLEPVTPRDQRLPEVQTPQSGLGQYSPRASGSHSGVGGPISPRDLNETLEDYNQFGREVPTSTPNQQEPASSPQSPVTSGRPIAGAGLSMIPDSSFDPSAGTGGKRYSLEPATPRDQGFPAGQRSPSGMKHYLFGSSGPLGSPYGVGGPRSDRDLNETPVNYKQFGQAGQTSTPITQEQGSVNQYHPGTLGSPYGVGDLMNQPDFNETPQDYSHFIRAGQTSTPIKQEPNARKTPRSSVNHYPPAVQTKTPLTGVRGGTTGPRGSGRLSSSSGTGRTSDFGRRPIKIEPGVERQQSQAEQKNARDSEIKDSIEDHSKIDLRRVKKEEEHKPIPRSKQDMDFYKSISVPESPVLQHFSDDLPGSRGTRRSNLPDMIESNVEPDSSVKSPDTRARAAGSRRGSQDSGSAQKNQALQPSAAVASTTPAHRQTTDSPAAANGIPGSILVAPGRKANTEREAYNRRIIIIDEAGPQPLRPPREILIDHEPLDRHITRDSVQPWNTADTGALLVKERAAAQIHRTPPRPGTPVSQPGQSVFPSGLLEPSRQLEQSRMASGYPGPLSRSPGTQYPGGGQPMYPSEVSKQPLDQSRMSSGSPGYPAGSPGTQYPGEESYAASASGPWMSLLPATPIPRDPRYHGPLVLREYRSMLGEYASPRERGGANRSLDLSDVEYLRFEPNVPLSSTRSLAQDRPYVTGPPMLRNTKDTNQVDANTPLSTYGSQISPGHPGSPQYAPMPCPGSSCMGPQMSPQMGARPQTGSQMSPQIRTPIGQHTLPQMALQGSQIGQMESQIGQQFQSQVQPQYQPQIRPYQSQVDPQMYSQMRPTSFLRVPTRTPETASVGVSSDRVVTPSYAEQATQPVDGKARSVGVPDDDDTDCFCEMKRNRPPICAIPVLEYCESCGELAPFFRTVPCSFIF